MFTSVILSDALANELIEQAKQTPHLEICGMLGGRIVADQIQVTVAQSLTNIAIEPSHSYEFAPAEFIETFYGWQRHQIDWVGVYHSHPTGSLKPSPTDIAQSHYEQIAYLIMGRIAHDWQIKAWCLSNCHAHPLPIILTA